MTDSGITAQMFARPADGFHTFAPENVAPLVAYLASPVAGNISGCVLLVWGKEVTLVNGPSLGKQFVNPDAWTVEDLDRHLTPHFAGREPIKSGFVLS
jgi:3-oxoacyl-[acyl-carrier protein] reductase